MSASRVQILPIGGVVLSSIILKATLFILVDSHIPQPSLLYSSTSSLVMLLDNGVSAFGMPVVLAPTPTARKEM